MKKILSILLLSTMGFFLSCGGVKTIAPANTFDEVKLKIAVQGQVDATLKLTAVDYTYEKLLSEVSNETINIPIGRTITATLVSADGKEVPKVFWYGGAVSKLDKEDLTDSTISFSSKEASYLGIYTDSEKLVLNNAVINLKTNTGGVVVFNKTNRGRLEYTLPTGFALDLEARDFDGYEFEAWKTESGTLISDKDKFSLKISSDTNIVPSFIGVQDFTFTSSMGGSIEVVIKKGTSTLSTNIIPAKRTVIIPIISSIFTNGSVTATAIPNDDANFSNWSATTTTDTNLKISKEMYTSPIMANFDFKNKWGGTSEKPSSSGDWIEISKPAHLRWLAETVNSGTPDGTDAAGKKYKIMNDIDYAGKEHVAIGGSAANGFSGVINGNNFSIKNAIYSKINSGQVAFVGSLRSGGVISNLTIDASVFIDSTVSYTAGIVAYSEGEIYNSVNKADIFSTGSHAGGIVALVSGNTSSTSKSIISNVYNSGDIDLKFAGLPAYVGGIVGLVERNNTTIVNAYNTGNITNISKENVYIGGIAGAFTPNNNIYYMTNVYSMGNTHGGGKDPIYAGGIIGGASSASITINVTNQFFLDKNILHSTGISSLSKAQPWTGNRIVSVSGLSTLHSTFNTKTPGVWGVKDKRPYIIGLEK